MNASDPFNDSGFIMLAGGSPALAYIRPVHTDKGDGYGVFAADGTQLAIFSNRDAAYFAAKQHDLEPVHIH